MEVGGELEVVMCLSKSESESAVRGSLGKL